MGLHEGHGLGSMIGGYNGNCWSEPSSGWNGYPDHGIDAGYNGGGWSKPRYGQNGYPDHGINASYNRDGCWSEPSYGYPDQVYDQKYDPISYLGARNNMDYWPETHRVYEVSHIVADGGWGDNYSSPSHDRFKRGNQPPHVFTHWHAAAPELYHDYSPRQDNLKKAHPNSKHNLHNGGLHTVYQPNNNSKPHDHGSKHGNSNNNDSGGHKHGSKASNHPKVHERPNGRTNHIQVKPSVHIAAHYGKHGNSSNKDDDGFNTESDDESVFTPRNHKHGSKVSNKAHEKPNGNSYNKYDDEFNSDDDDE